MATSPHGSSTLYVPQIVHQHDQFTIKVTNVSLQSDPKGALIKSTVPEAIPSDSDLKHTEKKVSCDASSHDKRLNPKAVTESTASRSEYQPTLAVQDKDTTFGSISEHYPHLSDEVRYCQPKASKRFAKPEDDAMLSADYSTLYPEPMLPETFSRQTKNKNTLKGDGNVQRLKLKFEKMSSRSSNNIRSMTNTPGPFGKEVPGK